VTDDRARWRSAARRSTARAYAALADRRAVPDLDWVVRLTGASPREVAETFAEADELVSLETAIRDAYHTAGRPGFAQIRAPFELYAITRLRRPDHIVEVGVSSGVSSAHFLAALARNRHGRLHSIDLPTFQRGASLARGESPVAIPPGRTSGWTVPSRLRTRWDLRIGPSQELLPRLARELPSIDVFLHDDLHTPRHLTFELGTVRPRLTPGAVVLADNTVWTGDAFPRFAKRAGARVRRRRRDDLVGLRWPD
jgi:predicted O-methyltransferase YrrM